ncbi:MAG: polysaccharide deacetylase family protein [Sphingobacteriia bacterium]|nr:polysaccharide deacetylase family protein [Sphingobacteriia bacterium]
MEQRRQNKTPGYILVLPSWVRYILCSFFLIHKKTKRKSIYLTFDDGPIPEVTPTVLKILRERNIKATFFCVGENIVKHRNVYDQVISEGHSVGSHTFHHLNGFKTNCKTYTNDAQKAAKLVSGNLFRPPYGRITFCQYLSLRPKFKIVLWSILSGDYLADFTSQDCINTVLLNIKKGDIIVFHDSIKAAPRMLEALPVVIDHLKEKGYHFETL